MGIAQCESSFNPKALGGGQYYGLMQMSSQVGSAYAGATGSALYDIDTNIRAGAGYLSANMKIFGNDYVKAISAYGYGGLNVKRGNYSTTMANSRIAIANSISSWLKQNGYA